jgi:hypothetical protein
MGGILDRYLAQGFLRIFVISLVCITSLYLVVDFFDRIGNFVDSGASMGTIIRYFLQGSWIHLPGDRFCNFVFCFVLSWNADANAGDYRHAI